MGGGKWMADDYADYSRSTGYASASASIREVFSHDIRRELDPRFIKLRESCDSADNPNSTPIILGLDVTGSMGQVAMNIAQHQLPAMMTKILEEKPVSDPHLMFMGIDDVHANYFALQVSQFEADIRIIEQLRMLNIVGGGGGNGSESYDLPWYFAATRTDIDSMNKRNKKGFIFTFGDEPAPFRPMTNSLLEQALGEGEYPRSITPAECLAMAKKMYKVFHITVNSSRGKTRASWDEMLGANALYVEDVTLLPEVICTAMQAAQGGDLEKLINRSKQRRQLEFAFSNALAA